MTKNLIIFGASSELALEFIKLAKEKNYYIHSFSRSIHYSSRINITNYFEEFNEIIEYINKIENPQIIFFNGFLKENRPVYSPSNSEIRQTLEVNFELPFLFIDNLIRAKHEAKFVVISSMASIKPRYKNFIYGLSKSMLENYLISNSNMKYLIFRFGKINTKMSKDHNNPPFNLSKEKSAKIILENLGKEGIIYPTFGLQLSAILLKVLPLRLINYIEKKLIYKNA